MGLPTFIHLAVVGSQNCEIPRTYPKIRTYNSLRPSKVIDLGANRDPVCNFLWVIDSNFGCICYRFRDIVTLCSKNSLVFPPHFYSTPPSGGMPCDINVIYTSLESTFNGLQFRSWQYGSIFIRLGVAGSQIYEISRNSKRIWASAAAVQGHPRSSILVSIESACATSY